MTLECGSPLDVQVESTDTLPSRKKRNSLSRVSGDMGLLQLLGAATGASTHVRMRSAGLPTPYHALKLRVTRLRYCVRRCGVAPSMLYSAMYSQRAQGAFSARPRVTKWRTGSPTWDVRRRSAPYTHTAASRLMFRSIG